ncbi:glycosyltransferase family 4 protein [Thiopseudomonas alkaliphila]|uniref:glycosyltransferase family 4 protein n=1 Tax=Thiopseudomonas alkaliphila TaxID=1697053 RepID=UPI00069E47C0|nr:glycosyltransferase family 4 protein [Thiopseudomonas alkaliphila]AKX54028.1 glycosyl transferase family 1 [Thiopseudomonas alkaliphila]
MNIALVSQNVSPGLLIFRKELILTLASQGHKIYCFAIDYTDNTREQVESLGGIPVDYSLNRTGLNPIRDIYDTWALSRKLKKIQPGLMLSFFSKPVIYGSLAAKLAGVPKRIGMLEGLGFTFTEQPFPLPFKVKLIRWIQVQLYRLSIPLLDKIIFLNADDPKDLLRTYSIKAKKVEILGGIGLDLFDYKFLLPDTKKHRFIFIGRLLSEKGINEFVAAAKIVKAKHSTVEFVVLGGLDKGNPGGLTENELDSLISENLIIYPGYVDDVSSWIASSSVFVLPSYREGVPRSTQEAMAIGRAVITTDVPGCRETVEDGVNGFLVPKWDVPALAGAMNKFIENPSLISEMGKESYRIAQEKFDVNIVNKRLISMLFND